MLLIPKVLIGPCVDHFLETQGALAQAAAQSTMLLSSAVLAMSAGDRRLVFLHELAHLRQLATPGNDPVRALEEEAWEAAHVWSRGGCFRIRGRARSPLNATAIVQGGAEGHPFAPPWYQKSPIEPIGLQSTIPVKDVVTIEKITLDAVLDTILAATGVKEFILVTHGSRSGLELPLRDGARAGAERNVIVSLTADHSGEETGMGGMKIKTPIKSEKDVADLTGLKEDEVRDLRAKMNRVQALKLKHVAFRACNMGSDQDSMQAFREFFGAASVSAPKQFDSYGKFSPVITSGVEVWAKAKRKAGFHISIDGDVGFGISKTDLHRRFQIVAAAKTKDAFKDWVKQHIVDDGWTAQGVIFHGLVVLHPASATSPPVFFVRDSEFIADIVKFPG